MQSHCYQYRFLFTLKKEPIMTIANFFSCTLKKKLTGTRKGYYCILLGFIRCSLFLCAFLKSLLTLTKALEDKLDAEISQVDQKVVLELDQLVSDQQATLQVS